MTTCKGSRTSLRSSADHRIRRASRTFAATSCIWRQAVSVWRPSIKPFRFEAAVLLSGHAEAPRDHRAYACHSRTTQAAAGAQRGGSGAAARCAGLKYQAALSVAYGAGLRATEVVSLKVSDIDSKRQRRALPVRTLVTLVTEIYQRFQPHPQCHQCHQ